nr:PilW family protein [uncultured Psychrobacter sp.]
MKVSDSSMRPSANNSCSQKRPYIKTMAGFTLIELMISLVLGLLISAAVIQVYIINTRTITIQQSASEVQDSSIFALQALEKHIRLANLGNPITSISSTSNHGGIVLTPTNLGSTNTTATTLLTSSTGSTGWTGVSNIANVLSDQLTIQYKNITNNSLYDCEGAEIAANSDDWVVERYFVRLATGATAGTGVQNLALACAAGRVSEDGTVTTAFSGNGDIIIPAVDQFNILLGVQIDVNQLTYLTPSTYLELTDKPPITTIKVGTIIRSTTPLITNADQESFTVLGADQTLVTDAARRRFYRRSYESTILLRNARMMSITATSPKLASTTTP